MSIEIKILLVFILLTLISIIVMLRAMKTAKPLDKCPKCGSLYPEFYFTKTGECQHCNYQNKANKSLNQ